MSMSTFTRTSIIGALLALTAAFVADVSIAQQQSRNGDAARPPPTALGDVVVTARKREERSLDVPFTVKAIETEQLAYLHVEGLGDLQSNIPNLFFSSDRSITGKVAVRGVGSNITTPGVGLYVDDVYQESTSLFNLPMFDVERIEFAKGPQGTLFGRNALAGAINVTTRRPSREFEGDLHMEVGSGNTQKAAVSIAGPLIRDSLFGRVTLGVQRRDGFFEFSDGGSADIDNYDAANVRLLFAPSDKFSADLKLSYFKRDGRAWAYHTVASINDDNGAILLTPVFFIGALSGSRQFDGIDNLGASLSMKWSLAGADIESITAYDDQFDETLFDVDNLPADVFHSWSRQYREVVTQELRAVSSGDTDLNWLIGAAYVDNRKHTRGAGSGSTFATLPGGVNTPYNGPTYTDAYAVFADLEYAINSRWDLGAGIRYDSIDKETYVGGRYDFATGAITVQPRFQDAATFTQWQPKLTVKYAPSDDSRVYLTIAKGFREGGFNATATVGTGFATFPNDELWSYELGAKSSFQDGRGSIDAAVFYMDVANQNGRANVFVPELGRNTSVTVPFGSVESYGAEVSLQYLATDQLTLTFDGGYTHAYVTELLPTALPGVAIEGEQTIDAPKWTARTTADWRVPVGNSMTATLLAALTGVGPTSFQGSSVTGALAHRDTYFLADLIVGLEWGRYRLSAFVKNLTDEVYAAAYTDGSSFQAFGGDGTNHAVIYNMPRYFGLSLRASF